MFRWPNSVIFLLEIIRRYSRKQRLISNNNKESKQGIQTNAFHIQMKLYFLSHLFVNGCFPLCSALFRVVRIIKMDKS